MYIVSSVSHSQSDRQVDGWLQVLSLSGRPETGLCCAGCQLIRVFRSGWLTGSGSEAWADDTFLFHCDRPSPTGVRKHSALLSVRDVSYTHTHLDTSAHTHSQPHTCFDMKEHTYSQTHTHTHSLIYTHSLPVSSVLSKLDELRRRMR